MVQTTTEPDPSSWAAALERAVSTFGHDHPALIFEGRDWDATLTFGSWLRATQAVTNSLHALGVRAGDRVAILAPAGPLWPVLQVAASGVGCVLVPINLRYGSDEMTYVIDYCRPRVIFCQSEARGRPVLQSMLGIVAGLAASSQASEIAIVEVTTPTPFEVNAADLRTTSSLQPHATPWVEFLHRGVGHEVAFERAGAAAVLLQWTSGTTSFPKGALLTSGATLEAMRQFAARMGIGRDDRVFNPQPFYHCGGSLTSTLFPLLTGATVICPERYSPAETFRLVRKHRCTARGGQAAMYAMELSHPEFDSEDFASVSKGWVLGSPELRRIVSKRMGMVGLISAYGLTETSSMCSVNDTADGEESRMTSEGRPLDGTEVGIRVDNEITTAAGVFGELCVRGWNVMLGYFHDETSTREVLDDAGWLRTGDAGFIDDNGEVHFLERLKDMIKPGGENVSSAEIERVIAALPGVANVAVVGMPDKRLGEVPAAFVELTGAAALSTQDIETHCRAVMADFKVPRSIRFVTEWPMTESGKIQKNVLKQSFAPADGGLVGLSG